MSVLAIILIFLAKNRERFYLSILLIGILQLVVAVHIQRQFVKYQVSPCGRMLLENKCVVNFSDLGRW